MFGNGVFFCFVDKGVAVKMSRLWFTKLLDIGDREKTFFLILLFVIRHDLEETPAISSADRLCNSTPKINSIL